MIDKIKCFFGNHDLRNVKDLPDGPYLCQCARCLGLYHVKIRGDKGHYQGLITPWDKVKTTYKESAANWQN